MPLLGDFLVVRGGGPSKMWNLCSWAIRWGTESPVSHAALFVGPVLGRGRPQIVEAQPAGARMVDWDIYPDAVWSTGHLALTEAQRNLIAMAGVRAVGTPYGMLDIAVIALAQKRLHHIVNPQLPDAQQPWWVRRIVEAPTAICSQLVVDCYRQAGVSLDAGVDSALVSPGDLWRLIGSPAVA